MKKINIDNAVLISNMLSMDTLPNNKVMKYLKKNHKNQYFLIKYDENFFNKNDLYVGLYHSVIYGFPSKNIMSFFPAKMTTYKYFKTLFPILNEKIKIMEHIEGISVQLFYDGVNNIWEIATKNNIGGNEIIMDDMYRRNIREVLIQSLGFMQEDPIHLMPFLEYFPKEFCFTFKLKKKINTHDDKIFYKCFLINVHMIRCAIPNNIKYIPEENYINWDCIECMKGLIHFPKKYYFKTYFELEESLQYLHNPYKYVLVNEDTGIKGFIQNNEYYTKENMYAINNFEKYLFLCLNRIYKPYEMYNIFPQYQRILYNMKQNYESFISNLHQAYIDYFIKKASYELPFLYKEHLMKIHKDYYITSLNEKDPIVVKRGHIKEYFNQLSPNELMHMLKN